MWNQSCWGWSLVVEPVLLGREPDAGTSVAEYRALQWMEPVLLLGMEACDRTRVAEYGAFQWNQCCWAENLMVKPV
jgi:hypothetical protein